MLHHNWKRAIAAAGFGLVVTTGVAFAQQDNAAPARAEGGQDREAGNSKEMPGPIDSVQDLQDTGKMLFKIADTNNDGQISQKEATDAGNLLVGGFFFRADADGNGTISQEEMKQARDALLAQQPMLRVVLQRAKAANAGQGQGNSNPAQGVASLLDGNGDKKLQATELRQAVQSSVQGLYAAADTNRDSQLSPAELNAAVIGAANAAAQATFAAADDDHNGALSQAEFDKAIREPANAVFRMVDANGDGQITQQEAQAVQRMVMSQVKLFQVQEPGNSPRHILEGANPRGAAPVPTIGTPRTGGTAPATTPAPAPAPRQQ